MSEERMITASAKVPESLHKAAHEKAAKEGLPLSWYIREFLRRWVAGGEELPEHVRPQEPLKPER